MRVLGVITARGGSRGVPRKNLHPLCGKPLLWYTAQAALAARRLNKVVLSTDDEEIAEVGRQYGLEVPFLRPERLARDDTPALPVVQHAVRHMEQCGESYEAVCLLQPTNPLRLPEHIDACIELLAETDADSVITMLPVPEEYNPHWVYFGNGDGLLRLSTGESAPVPRRQDLPPAYHREGSVYVTRRDVLINAGSLSGNRIRGYVRDAAHSVNINTPADLGRAEEALRDRESLHLSSAR